MTWQPFSLNVTPELIERFESRVDRSGDCHVWTGTRLNKFGHGCISVGGHNAPAHRVAWVIATGRAVPAKHVIRHTCDVPACVNPDHLVLGTFADNMNDAIDRDRVPVGEAHYRSKLTDDMVREIRARFAAGDASAMEMANEYPVSASAITQMLAGKTWKHITGGVPVLPTKRSVRPHDPASFKRGNEHPRSRYNAEQVSAFKSLVRGGMSVSEAGRQTHIAESSARQIAAGRSWAHVA